jgi:hypothetical protein
VPLDLLPFLVASVPVTVVPSADMALVTRQFLVTRHRMRWPSREAPAYGASCSATVRR